MARDVVRNATPRQGEKTVTQEYEIIARLDDEGSHQVFGKLIVDVPYNDDGYNIDCVVNEIMEAASRNFVRDCIWEAKEINTGVAHRTTAASCNE